MVTSRGCNAAPSGPRKGKCGGGSSQFASSLRFEPDALRIPTYLPTQDRRSPPCLRRHVLGFGFLHPLRFRGQRLPTGLNGFHLELDDDRREQKVKEPLPCFRLDVGRSASGEIRSVPWSFLSSLAGQLTGSSCQYECRGAHRASSKLYAGNVVRRLSSTGPPTVKW